MQLLNHLGTYIDNSKNRSDFLLKKINNNGFEPTAMNKNEVMKNDNFQGTKEREISAINNATSWGNHYDNTLSAITQHLESFKTKFLEKQTATNETNTTAIDMELQSINDSIGKLLNTKIGKEKLFDVSTELVIGDNIKTPRTYSKEWILFNNDDITKTLQGFIDNTETNSDIIDDVHKFVSEKSTSVGTRQQVLENTKNFYKNLELNANEYVDRLYQLEETLMDFNQETIKYEALSKMVQRVSSLSLVNYI